MASDQKSPRAGNLISTHRRRRCQRPTGLLSDNPISLVSADTHLVSIHFLIGSVSLDRFVTASEFTDKFLGIGRVTRSNRGDLVNDVFHAAPTRPLTRSADGKAKRKSRFRIYQNILRDRGLTRGVTTQTSVHAH